MSDPRDTPMRPDGDVRIDGDERGADAADPAASDPREPAAAEAELRTFLIADIRGYTVYTTEHGADAAAELATRFAAIVREVVVAHDGFLLELRGDEALAVFVLARRALRAALELQARFGAELPRGVGIGLDAGEAIPVEGGYRGSALNLAARLCGQAGSGETLASEAVIHLAAKVDGIGYADPRTYRLKGLDEPVRAVHVVPAERGSKKPIRYGRDRRSDRRLLAAVGLGLLVLTVAAVGLSGGWGLIGSAGRSPIPSGASMSASSSGTAAASAALFADSDLPLVAYLDSDTGHVLDRQSFRAPSDVSMSADNKVWVLGLDPVALHEIDPRTHQTVKVHPFPLPDWSGVTVDAGTIWATDRLAPRVIGVDARTDVQTRDFPISKDPGDQRGAGDIAAGGGSIWVAQPDAGRIVRLDPDTGAIQADIDVDFPQALGFGDGALWVTSNGSLTRIDPATNSPSFKVDLAPGTGLAPGAYMPVIAFAGGFTWVADAGQGLVFKVDRNGIRAGTYQVGAGALPLAGSDHTMWVGVQGSGTLVGIDVTTGAMRTITLGHKIDSVAAAAGTLVVTLDRTAEDIIAAIPGRVLTIASPGAPFQGPTPDPAVNGSFEGRQAAFITCAGLLRYPDKPAPDGWTLEPEVATAMPTVSADGRTYTFTIRDGFAFSPPSNEPVTAETYRSTIERSLSAKLGDQGKGIVFLSDIVGARAFHDGTADHVSGLVASGDTLTVKLAAAAPDFPNRLTLPYFCPLPIDTPAALNGLDPSPPLSAAGPYYMSDQLGGELAVFRKNPNYHGSRPQPYDAFAFRVGFTPGDAVGRVESGLADAATSGWVDSILNGSSDRAKEWGPGSDAAASGGQRWFGAPRFGFDFIAVNPSRPVLSDPKVRAAISLALDRSALATALGQAPAAGPLPPSVAGSIAAGAGVPQPDVVAAKALMGGRTGKIVLATWEGCGPCLDVANTVVGELAPIGIKVVVRQTRDLWGDVNKPGTDIGLVDGSYDTDFGDPVTLMATMSTMGWLPAADRAALARLETFAGTDRIAGATVLATRLVDQEHLMTPIGYPVYPFYLGGHVGCGFVQPAIGAVDLLSLCPKDGTTSSGSPAPSTSPSATPAASPSP